MVRHATNGYVVTSEINPKMTLCTDGEFHARSITEPSKYRPKVFVLKANAEKAHPCRIFVPVVDGQIQYQI